MFFKVSICSNLIPSCTFSSASAAYHSSFVEQLLVFRRDIVEPKNTPSWQEHEPDMLLPFLTIKGTMRYLKYDDIFLVTVICQASSYVKRTSLVLRPRELIRDRNIQHITIVNIEP